MAEAKLQRMGPKSKKELKAWEKQEKNKQKAIENAFHVNNDRLESLK